MGQTVPRTLGLMLTAAAAMLTLSTAAAQSLTEMRIGVLRIASQAPFFLAVERGWFEEAGINPRLVYFDAAVPATVAIVSRDVDVSVIGITQAFFNLAAQGGITVVAGHSREVPGYHNTGIFASDAAWRAGVRTMQDLAGRSIGLTTLGSTNHYAVARIAEKYGFDINRNRLVPAQGIGNLAAMLIGNQVEVVAAPATAFIPLMNDGHAHLIGWAGDEVSWQLAAIASSPRVVAERRDALQAVVDIYARGAAEYQRVLLDRNPDGSFRHPEEAEELLAIISSYTSVPPESLIDSLAYIDPRLDVASIFEVAEWSKEQRMIDLRTDPARFIDLSFVEGHENIPEEMLSER